MRVEREREIIVEYRLIWLLVSLLRLSDLLDLVKIRIVIATVLLYALSAMLASHSVKAVLRLDVFSMLLACALLASMGANGFNNYYDRDIDSMMRRTRHRAIPSGRVAPATAFGLALTLLLASAVLVTLSALLALSPLILLVYILAISSYCLLYTVVLKRRTSLSILAASLASACIPATGWIAVTNSINGEGMLFILITFVWGILHFTGVAIVYSRDYARARIPALPVSLSEKSVSLLLTTLVLCYVILTMLVYPLAHTSILYILGVLSLNSYLFYHLVKAVRKPVSKYTFKIYKATAPHLLAVFLLALIDKLIVL